MNRQQKEEYAKKLKDQWGRSQVALFADYRGLTASQADLLRKRLRAEKVEVKVLKNSMARLVTRDGSLGEAARQMMEALTGPTLVAFSYDDSTAIARVLKQFSQEEQAFELKEGLMGTTALTLKEVGALADLPAKPVLVAQVLGVLNAPISRFLGVLQAVPQSVLQVLVALEKKKANS